MNTSTILLVGIAPSLLLTSHETVESKVNLDKDGNPTDVGQDDVVVVVTNTTDLGQNDDDVHLLHSIYVKLYCTVFGNSTSTIIHNMYVSTRCAHIV